MSISHNNAIDAIQEYCEYFTARVPNSTRDRWVMRLRELPIDRQILSAATRRCADNDLGPAWSRLRSAIAVERSIEASKRFNRSTEESREYEDWLQGYRAEGLSRGFPPSPDNRAGRPLSPEINKACYQVVGRILRGTVKCPREYRHHDVHATGDKEETWFWELVRKECG
jgi:hypothetical protein